MTIEMKPIITCYDMRLTLAQINILATFLDRYIPGDGDLYSCQPENTKLNITPRYSNSELDDLCQIRSAAFRIAHG